MDFSGGFSGGADACDVVAAVVVGAVAADDDLMVVVVVVAAEAVVDGGLDVVVAAAGTTSLVPVLVAAASAVVAGVASEAAVVVVAGAVGFSVATEFAEAAAAVLWPFALSTGGGLATTTASPSPWRLVALRFSALPSLCTFSPPPRWGEKRTADKVAVEAGLLLVVPVDW